MARHHELPRVRAMPFLGCELCAEHVQLPGRATGLFEQRSLGVTQGVELGIARAHTAMIHLQL